MMSLFIRKAFIPGSVALAALAMGACDEGRIYPDSPSVDEAATEVRLEARLSGAESWPEGYTLSLAAFADGEDYALSSANIAPDAATSEGDAGDAGVYTATLHNLPASTSTVEICVIDRLRRRVATFASQPFDPTERLTVVEADGLDVSIGEALQQEIFSPTCANCHGGAAFAGAGLHLTPGRSLPELIEVASTKDPAAMRVIPGDPDASLLYEILTTDASADWAYDHSREIYSQVRLDLIRNWIQSL
ncbi:MAG: hypothetical protein K2G75_04730 [Muribaculaceae bacterium]|nr:hypothetical protein [Muribaculaceae bacterium]